MSLYDYQAKANRYRKALKYLKNRATTNQNQTLHSQKLKRKVLKHKINGNHSTKKERKKEKHRINWKTRFKMAIYTYLAVINLNVNRLNAPLKRHRYIFEMQSPKHRLTPCKHQPDSLCLWNLGVRPPSLLPCIRVAWWGDRYTIGEDSRWALKIIHLAPASIRCLILLNFVSCGCLDSVLTFLRSKYCLFYP